MRLLAIVAGTACLWFAAFTSASAEQFDIITHTTPSPGVDQFRIDKPNPTQHAVEYPSITFMPGDVVTVNAGGCVQSGGTGNTWHRYVNPSGGEGNHTYKGLITIPFATGVLEPIANYVGKSVTVRPGAPAGAHLQLGFQDDDYSDNGYYSHDDGPNDQCKGGDGGPAWVTVAIAHGGATPAPANTAPWDLVYTQFDANGVPLNATWSNPDPDPASCTWPWNGSNPPLCTTQIADTDTHWSCQAFHENYGFGGHANWIAGTYNGSVAWDQKSPWGTDDDDYSVNLTTPNAAGMTSGSPYGVHVEFDSDETIDNLTDNFQVPWWKLFRSAVDAGDTQAHSLIDGHQLIVTGLTGVDFAHTPGAESHPAWGFALESNKDPGDDTWAMFVRNWGDEGYCSGDQHYIDYIGQQYSVSLPWPAGAVSGTVKPSSTFSADGDSTPGMSVTFMPGSEVRVTFTNMADPSKHQLIGGELHIAWTSASPRRRTLTPVRFPRPVIATQKDGAESSLEKAVRGLSAAQMAVYRSALPPHRPVSRIKHRLAMRTSILRTHFTRRVIARPRIRSVPDPAHVARTDARIEALRKAYGGTIPGFPRKP